MFKQFLLLVLLSITAFPALGQEAGIECVNILEAEPQSAMLKAQKILAFMSVDHPLQLLAIRNAASRAEIMFWLHWSLGFQFATEPRRYDPRNKSYNLDPKTFWTPWRRSSITPPSSGAEYMQRRRSDDFAQYLAQIEWETSPAALTKQIDDLMISQAHWSKIIRTKSGWGSLNKRERMVLIDNALSGILSGIKELLNIPRAESFLIKRPAAAAAIRRDALTITIQGFLHDLKLSLADRHVITALHRFLVTHYPTLVVRRDDFQIYDLSKEPNLDDLKRHVLRKTQTRERLAELRAAFYPVENKSENTLAPEPATLPPPIQAQDAVQANPFVELEGLAANLPVEFGAQLELTTTNELLALGKRNEVNLSEVLNIMTQLRSTSNLDKIRERVRRLSKSAREEDLGYRVIGITREMRILETESKLEGTILAQLQRVYLANKNSLVTVLKNLDDRFKVNIDVEGRDLDEANHLQSMLMTFLTMEDLLNSSEHNCQSRINLVQAQLRNLYAFGMEIAAMAVTDAEARLHEILDPMIEDIVR